jgi:nucleotide-binding universal stress UspA family protein
MSIFPTRIPLATDGSSEARLAARTAVDPTQKTDSEVHAIPVVDIASRIALLYPEATDPKRVEQMAPVLKEALERHLEQRGREVLDGEVERVRSAGATVAQSHLMMGEAALEIVHLAEDLEAGPMVLGSRGHGGQGERLRAAYPSPWPGTPTTRHDSPRVRSNQDLRRRRIPRTSGAE